MRADANEDSDRTWGAIKAKTTRLIGRSGLSRFSNDLGRQNRAQSEEK